MSSATPLPNQASLPWHVDGEAGEERQSPVCDRAGGDDWLAHVQVSAEEACGVPSLTAEDRAAIRKPDGFWSLVAAPLFRRQAIRRLGARCRKCGWRRDIRALQIDHVNGDGHLDRNTLRLYRDTWAGRRADVQVLCANCNQIKRFDNREDLTRKPRAPRRPNGFRMAGLDNST